MIQRCSKRERCRDRPFPARRGQAHLTLAPYLIPLLLLLAFPESGAWALAAKAPSHHRPHHKHQDRRWSTSLRSTTVAPHDGRLSPSSCGEGDGRCSTASSARELRPRGEPPLLSRLAGLLAPLQSPGAAAWGRQLRPAASGATYSDYQRRKNEWARRYTSVEALRDTFGRNQNRLWGDLDAPTARRLYKTLLPKALLDLYRLGVEPQDLAPLAYRARLAAKLYARERCQVPARWLAHWYDGFRQWRRYGSFDTTGMSYQQIWEKYASVILSECAGREGLSEHDVTAMICCKILEKSCTTNEMVDRLVLSHRSGDRADQADLQQFTETLERDVRTLLQLEREHATGGGAKHLDAKRFRMLRRIARLKKRVANGKAAPPPAAR